MAVLRDTLALDPLDWWARHLNGDVLKCDHQICLDVAHDYARAGLFENAIIILASRTKESQRDPSTQPRVATNELPRGVSGSLHNPEWVASIGGTTPSGLQNPSSLTQGSRHNANPGLDASVPLGLSDQNWGALPLVHYTLGWLEQKRGGSKAALKHFKRAATLPADYCFPARLEEIAILEAAMAVNPRDAKAPYYLGNLLYDRRRHVEAIRLWEKSARLDGNFSITWRNLGIGYFNILGNPAKSRAAYDRAVKVNPADGRLLYERDQLWKRLGEKPEKRLRELEKRLVLVQQRDDLSVELCALYNQVGQHEKALALVSARNFQPWEGGEGGPLGQWVRSHLALGRKVLGQGGVRSPLRAGGRADKRGARGVTRPTLAIEHFQAALTAPLNLGEAKHLLANQSDIHYWLGCALAAAGEARKAKLHWLTAATCKGDFQEMSVRAFSEMTYYSALAWEKLAQPVRAKKLFHDLLAYARQLQKSEAKIDYFATSLPTMLLFDDDIQFRQETAALFLQAQARLGLGSIAAAEKLVREVLLRDPNHAAANDLSREITIILKESKMAALATLTTRTLALSERRKRNRC